MVKPRPVYLNLLQIRQPVPAIVSILHRISGALLFLFIPLLLYLLQATLVSPDVAAAYYGVLAHPIVKIVLLVLLWAYLHHICAGVRHLIFDLHIGTALAPARASSMAVLVISVVLTIIVAVRLW
ncbi:MAG TPA: succinate dehydrogenase, cytochrome b556 subunit [Burkholderiales bacterium]|jgi:succinate dehydrogenase / fumarate reductase cytochrome b subunit|nr:succinate dehydrogenase, cytochrome b556 subunit [Burkholderiales bacterium]